MSIGMPGGNVHEGVCIAAAVVVVGGCEQRNENGTVMFHIILTSEMLLMNQHSLRYVICHCLYSYCHCFCLFHLRL
jgi:hypothetical protein